MRKLLGLGAIVAAFLFIAAPAGAQDNWTNTARNVASILTDRWNTSDGEPIANATCHGEWSYPHIRSQRGMEFQRFRCIERDDLDRRFTVNVVVVGRAFKLYVTELSCNDAASDDACP